LFAGFYLSRLDKECEYDLNIARLDLEIQAYYLLQKDFNKACLLFNKIHNCNVTIDSVFPYKLKRTESSDYELAKILNRLKLLVKRDPALCT